MAELGTWLGLIQLAALLQLPKPDAAPVQVWAAVRVESEIIAAIASDARSTMLRFAGNQMKAPRCIALFRKMLTLARHDRQERTDT